MSALHQILVLSEKTFQKCREYYCILMCLDLSQEGNYQFYWILAVTICFKDFVDLNTLMETNNNKISDL
jgi:hypothetical protein